MGCFLVPSRGSGVFWGFFWWSVQGLMGLFGVFLQPSHGSSGASWWSVGQLVSLQQCWVSFGPPSGNLAGSDGYFVGLFAAISWVFGCFLVASKGSLGASWCHPRGLWVLLWAQTQMHTEMQTDWGLTRPCPCTTHHVDFKKKGAF